MKCAVQPHVSPDASPSARSAGAAPFRLMSALAVLASLLFATSLQAQDATQSVPVGPDTMEPQPMPFPLNDNPLAHDPGFNGGNFYANAFGGASSNYDLGRKLVRIGGGDVVSATA